MRTPLITQACVQQQRYACVTSFHSLFASQDRIFRFCIAPFSLSCVWKRCTHGALCVA